VLREIVLAGVLDRACLKELKTPGDLLGALPFDDRESREQYSATRRRRLERLGPAIHAAIAYAKRRFPSS
jgi:hypothetical protein